MGPPCDLSWGKPGIGIAGDTSPDVLWTGWSDPVHLWEGETEAGQRREHPCLSSSQALQPIVRRTLGPRPSPQFLHKDM